MTKGNFKHGYYGTPTYKSWSGMKERCSNSNRSNFRWYGARGITYSKRWETFDNFLIDMGECPNGKTLDRIDVNKNYFKRNCRWATPKEQCRNKRNNLILRGKTLSEWSEILGIKRSTLAQRYYVYGWSVDRVLLTK